jgi:hypothetical protein
VVVPAHNEGSGIRRLLDELTGSDTGSGLGHLEVVVVCNGCTDDTAEIARTYGPAVQVLEIEEPSKAAAMVVGDEAATCAYRAYVDADIVIGRKGLGELVDALEGGVGVTAPARKLSMTGAERGVRWYYDVWERLPAVASGAFGRGVVVLSPEGNARVRALPRVMSDDLAASEVFSSSERRVVETVHAVIEVPRTMPDLVRRRIRIATGNAQLDGLGLRTDQARTRPVDLVRIALGGPSMPAKVAVFVGVTVVARLRARRRIRGGDFTTWLRDASSREQ